MHPGQIFVAVLSQGDARIMLEPKCRRMGKCLYQYCPRRDHGGSSYDSVVEFADIVLDTQENSGHDYVQYWYHCDHLQHSAVTEFGCFHEVT